MTVARGPTLRIFTSSSVFKVTLYLSGLSVNQNLVIWLKFAALLPLSYLVARDLEKLN
jgi:hypothetical protein